MASYEGTGDAAFVLDLWEDLRDYHKLTPDLR